MKLYTSLQRDIEYYQGKLRAYMLTEAKYIDQSTIAWHQNQIVEARKKLADFEDQARRNSIPHGWLDCRFE